MRHHLQSSRSKLLNEFLIVLYFQLYLCTFQISFLENHSQKIILAPMKKTDLFSSNASQTIELYLIAYPLKMIDQTCSHLKIILKIFYSLKSD